MHRTLALVVVSCLLACNTAAPRAELAALQFEATRSPAPAPLTADHFVRDAHSTLSEENLRSILSAPVSIEPAARVGVVPVIENHERDRSVPTDETPAMLVSALERSGAFENVTEVSAEWEVDRGPAGLRELAARYRTEYLLLVRQRFSDAVSGNAWAVGYATVIGALFFPGATIDSNGVLEATLFDVKTGTALFTVNERVHGSTRTAPPQLEASTGSLHRTMTADATAHLVPRLLEQVRRLAPPPAGVSSFIER